MQLYKYLPYKHATAMVERGSMGIGTLQSFRASEDRLRGDRDEGSRNLILPTPEGRAVSFPELHPFQKRIVAGTRDLGPGFVFVDSVFSERHFVEDCYVYCLSTMCGQAAAGEYDTCVRVSDHRRFMRALALAFVTHLGVKQRVTVGHRPVHYGSREELYPGDPNADPIFVKASDPFSVEHEYRIAWEWDGMNPQGPVIFDVPEIRRFLRIVEIPGRP